MCVVAAAVVRLFSALCVWADGQVDASARGERGEGLTLSPPLSQHDRNEWDLRWAEETAPLSPNSFCCRPYECGSLIVDFFVFMPHSLLQ